MQIDNLHKYLDENNNILVFLYFNILVGHSRLNYQLCPEPKDTADLTISCVQNLRTQLSRT